MKYLGAISNDYDMVNKKYVDDAVAGAGGDKVFVVTYDDTGSTPTPSANELSAAVEAGKAVFCYDISENRMLSLTYYSTVDGEYFFASAPNNAGYVRWISYAYDSWDENGYYYLAKNTEVSTTTWYGTCSTTASTTAKAITITRFTSSDFKAGTIIGVMFTTGNTAATPTLNINSLGAKSISIAGTAINSTTNVLKWSANTMIYFMYDGTYFRYMYATAAASTTQPHGANTWYGTSSTAAATQAKTSTIDNFVLTKGALIVINFTYANTYSSAKITLNINSTGAKDVYYNNAVTSSTNKPLWKANSTVTFVYSGSYYYIVNINPLPTDQIPDGDEIPWIPRGQAWQDPLYDQTLGETIGSSLENSLAYTYSPAIEITGSVSQSVAAESGAMNFVAFDSVFYKNDVTNTFSLDSSGGVKVNSPGYYKVTASLCGSGTANALSNSNSVNGNYRRGLFIYAGTASDTNSCTEWVSNVQYNVASAAMQVGPQIIYANSNDIIYLVFRPQGQAGTYNPGLLRQSYLLVERMPNQYPTS